MFRHALKTACALALMFMLAPIVVLLMAIGPHDGFWQRAAE